MAEAQADDEYKLSPQEEQLLSFSIADFCMLTNLSRTHYFKMKQLGQGPKEMRIGDTIRITASAILDWQRERQEAALSKEYRAKNQDKINRSRRAGILAAMSVKHVSKRGPRTRDGDRHEG